MDSLSGFLQRVLRTEGHQRDRDHGREEGRQDEDAPQDQDLVWQPEIPLSKEPSESWVTMTEIVLPSHCDGRGFCLGGTVLSWIDIAAGIAAKKHGVYPAVTRSVDAVHFLGPITTQNIVVVQACVNRTWKSSLELDVTVMTQSLVSDEEHFCCHAYLTFVALPQPPLTTLLPLTGSLPMPKQVPGTARGTGTGTGSGTGQATLATTDQTASRAALANSPAGRRYSFSLPSASKSHGSKQGLNNLTRPIQLPAIEPISKAEMDRYTMAQSRREARLLEARTESKVEENKLMSDIRDQMRHWNVSQILNRVAKLSPAEDGTPRIPIQATFAESAQLVLPQHANSLSITFGGQVMKWMENICAVSASRFARVPIVTASMDSLQFHRKTMIGDCLTMRSIVTRVFHTSMEIYVFVDSENLVTGKQTFTNEAFFTMVALQPSVPLSPSTLNPTLSRLPILCPGSDLENALSEAGEQRRLRRLEQRRDLAKREAAQAPLSPFVL